MLLFLLPVCAGAAIGFCRRGRLDQVTQLRLRLPALVLVALALQASLVRVGSAWRLPVVLGTYGAAGGWMVLNLVRRPRLVQVALGLVAAGWALNVAVMAPNGGMPVSAHALAGIG
ncbi:MAG: DUF5317 family protein, partial [Acidimicrobiales bacterium]